MNVVVGDFICKILLECRMTRVRRHLGPAAGVEGGILEGFRHRLWLVEKPELPVAAVQRGGPAAAPLCSVLEVCRSGIWRRVRPQRHVSVALVDAEHCSAIQIGLLVIILKHFHKTALCPRPRSGQNEDTPER